jgi:hypothetical protein
MPILVITWPAIPNMVCIAGYLPSVSVLWVVCPPLRWVQLLLNPVWITLGMMCCMTRIEAFVSLLGSVISATSGSWLLYCGVDDTLCLKQSQNCHMCLEMLLHNGLPNTPSLLAPQAFSCESFTLPGLGQCQHHTAAPDCHAMWQQCDIT